MCAFLYLKTKLQIVINWRTPKIFRRVGKKNCNMHKRYLLVAMSAILVLCFYSCREKHVRVYAYAYAENPSFKLIPQIPNLSDVIYVDSILKKDTSYYKIYTLVCDADTVFQFKYTQLLAPNQPIKAYFIPRNAFEGYKSAVQSSFKITPSILEWNNPLAYCSVEKMMEQDIRYRVDISLITESMVSHHWYVKDTTDIPDKIYYYYDWACKMHYSYMQFNADDAIVSFAITNATIDTITPIDSISVWKKYPNGRIVALTQSPWEIKDTIDLLKDTTYTYLLQGFLKGQACGSDTYQVQTHKGEIVSQQDVRHSHKGRIYEYDE